jgi:hypothetical protein
MPPHLHLLHEPQQAGAQSYPTQVQRQAVPKASTSEAGIEPAPAEIPGEEQAVPEPDVDELARKVYAEVKRRLSLEWERIRQRF